MATNYKVLGQSNPAATTATALYTVPSSTSAVCSTLVICNMGVSTTFRVAIRKAGEALAADDYLCYDSPVAGNDSIFLTLGITLATTDIVSIYAGTANVAFNLFGSEITA